MKKLYIVRHAKSSWSNTSLSDFDRPLNKRGFDDAPKMGQVLKKLNILPDLILSSPAMRALTTAEIISRKMGYSKENIQKDKDLYHAGPLDIIEIINSINNDYKSIMVIAHNPGLTHLVNTLSNFNLPNLPTCAFVEIEFHLNDWQAVSKRTGKVVKYEYPKKYK